MRPERAPARRSLLCLLSLLAFPCQRAAAADAAWERTSFSAGTVTRLVFDPQDENVVYAATMNGLYWSDDAGRNWKSRVLAYQPDGKIDMAPVRGVAVDPYFHKLVYVATSRGLFQSRDGTRFRKINLAGSGLAGNRFDDVVAVPVAPGTALPGGGVRSSDVLAAGESKLWRSQDGGQTWTQAADGLGSPLSLHGSASGASLYAVAGATVSLSRDMGRRWLDVTPQAGWSYKGLAFGPQDTQAVLAGSARRDGAPSSRVFVSTGAPETWAALPAALPEGLEVESLLVGPGQTLYLGTSRGVLEVGASSWSWMNRGLDDGTAVTCVQASPSGKFLLAGTRGRGILRADLGKP